MIEIEEGSGNVYADLGFDDAEEMMVKAQLATKIGEIIKGRKWSQQRAADVLGIPQSKLSKMLRGQFRGISEAKMLDCLARLGRDVQIVVGPARRSASAPISSWRNSSSTANSATGNGVAPRAGGSPTISAARADRRCSGRPTFTPTAPASAPAISPIRSSGARCARSGKRTGTTGSSRRPSTVSSRPAAGRASANRRAS